METERSKPHRRVEGVLDELGVRYTSECEDFPPYRLDIYVPEFHLCIEVDGPYHGKKRDAVRDELLWTRYLIPTLRISAGDDLRTVMFDIKSFLESNAPSTAFRLKEWRETNG